MKLLSLFTCLFISTSVVADPDLTGLADFIEQMQSQHGFSEVELEKVFADVEVKQSIIKAISRPAEKSKPWYEYRKIFLGSSRIDGGVKFWNKHADSLAKAEQKYGVPAKIIVAILGVETKYGGNVGGYRVVDALSTLAFEYPPRSKFFKSELENFLLLTRDEGMSPLAAKGSYAGAMGLPQFMPSSYRHYAVDFDGDGHTDIWTNPNDAIGSIANYLKVHGWISGESIVHRTTVKGKSYLPLVEKGMKPSIERETLKSVDISLQKLPDGTDLLALIELEQENGPEFWLARQNFYSITRYNHSTMYAMAVTQLGEEISKKRAKK
ncbi:MAG: lytic murein transglycosylase B [Gammaproteobacteria bacterium]|nr:MAG: lytic murein transglycosylase B [Gammaproteobacteria bacterium]